jgi:endoglucanase
MLPRVFAGTRTTRRRGRPLVRHVLIVIVALAGVASLMAAGASARVPRAHAAYRQKCRDPYPAKRDPSNPLNLAQAPGSDPLTGAQFYVPGPAHGVAAQAIVSLTHVAPSGPNETWAHYSERLQSGAEARRLAADPKLAHQVAELSKIAGQPEAQRFSSYVGGGKRGAVFAQVQKIFCDNLKSDPGSIPIVDTYYLHADLGRCPTPAQVRADQPVFHRRVNEMAASTARRPAVYLLEVDAIGVSGCVKKMGSLPEWEQDLRYEITKISALPHTVVYVEAGYSDFIKASYSAKILNAIGVRRIRGFYTNDTHLNWTIDEVRWAQKISAMTHGAHFIVNTADNGKGPLRNPHPKTQGTENLCNPPGRGLGPLGTTDTGFPLADAFMWMHPPGNSSGCGPGPAGGVFWLPKAIGLAERANQQLGPGFASRPY